MFMWDGLLRPWMMVGETIEPRFSTTATTYNYCYYYYVVIRDTTSTSYPQLYTSGTVRHTISNLESSPLLLFSFAVQFHFFFFAFDGSD